MESACNPNDYFRKLIDLWICFNGWLGLVVDSDSNLIDREWYLINAAGQDKVLQKSFNDNYDNNTAFRKYTDDFSKAWPLVSHKLIKKKDDFYPPQLRAQGQEYYLEILSTLIERDEEKYLSPRFWRLHIKSHSPIPKDWAHVIEVIYKVRCDLFHEGKAHKSDPDRFFVRHAFEILWGVWGKKHYKKCHDILYF